MAEHVQPVTERNVSEIIAAALLDAGVEVVTHVPGHGATETFTAYRKLSSRTHPISFHEEVAYTIAHGASLVGKRSAVVVKAHGIVKAGNSVLDSLASGTTAGLLALVFDDEKGTSSDGIFDVAAFLDWIGMPYRRAGGDYYQDVSAGFEASERLSVPHALIVEAGDAEQGSAYTGGTIAAGVRPYVRDITQHFVGPLFGAYQHRVLSAKKRGERWADVQRPGVPVVPDGLPDHWRSRVSAYLPLFEAFKDVRGAIVTGDTSTSSFFALPPYDCIDLVTYMGGSIPLALGAHLAGFNPVWAVTGDFSFVAAGHLGLPEAVQRSIPLKLLIVCNGIAEATGGQPVPGQLLALLLAGYGRYVRYIHDPDEPGEIRDVLGEASAADELRIVVANYRKA